MSNPLADENAVDRPDVDLRPTAPVRLVGRSVVLRSWQDEDAPRIVEACNDAQTIRWMDTAGVDLDRARRYVTVRREMFANGQAVTWCAADRGTDVCLCSINLQCLDVPGRDSAQLGYWAHPDARGKGLTYEACELAVRWALNDLGLSRIIVETGTANVASRRLAERLDFVQTGQAGNGDAIYILRSSHSTGREDDEHADE